MKVGWEEKTYKASQLMQVNPPKMEKFDDVSNMTYLNEASVLWNLKSRYVCKLIYVSLSFHLKSQQRPRNHSSTAFGNAQLLVGRMFMKVTRLLKT